MNFPKSHAEYCVLTHVCVFLEKLFIAFIITSKSCLTKTTSQNCDFRTVDLPHPQVRHWGDPTNHIIFNLRLVGSKDAEVEDTESRADLFNL